MIKPFGDALRRLPAEGDESDSPADSVEPSSHQENSENSFLHALPVVRSIVRRRTVSAGDAADLEQGIILRLLLWRKKNHEKSAEMSPADWESFAARTAYNEANRRYSKPAREVPLDAALAVESSEPLVGDSDAEFQSLAAHLWQETCELTLRQRRALLLHSRKLIVYFLKGGIRDEELARSLEIETDKWLEIKTRLPLSNAEIASLIGGEEGGDERQNLEPVINSIKKARHATRAKFRKLTNR